MRLELMQILEHNLSFAPKQFHLDALKQTIVEVQAEEEVAIAYLPIVEEIRRCNAQDDFVFVPIWGKQRKGKCQDGNTEILTPNGIAKLRNLKAGDQIIDLFGSGLTADYVLETFTSRRPVLEVKTEGSILYPSPEHQFLTDIGWKMAKDLKINDILYRVPKNAIKDACWKDVNFKEPHLKLSRVLKLSQASEEERLYDITTTHGNYIANGIVVHNSSLAMVIMYLIYGDWWKALDNMVFTLPDLIERLFLCSLHKIVIPCITWDDIGVHGGKRTKSQEGSFKSFSESFDAIGTVVHGFLTTQIRPDSTVPALRERIGGEIQVEPRGHFNYMEYSWRINYYVPAQPFFVKVWVEEGLFDKIPDEVYNVYKLDRQRLLDIKFAETTDRLYSTTDIPIPALSELEVDALKRIANKKSPIRQDHLKEFLLTNGYDKNLVDLGLARLEANYLAVKVGQIWKITPRGTKALETPKSEIQVPKGFE